MSNLFFAMLAGHLIADFWLQPSSWVQSKRELGAKSPFAFLHAAIASVLPVLFTFRLEYSWFIPVLFISHFIIDVLKGKVKENILFFLLDQGAHILILAVLSVFFIKESLMEPYRLFWIYTCAFILLTNPVGILNGIFLKTITGAGNVAGEVDVSSWIGILERILILIFILAGEFEAIGFLVAAKSVFRFNDTKNGDNRKAEYFLLGTLVSFAVAIAIGLGLKSFIH